MRDSETRSEAQAAVTEKAAAPRRKSLVREYGEAIIVAVLLALVIRAFVVQAFTIPSGSMMDTLLVGDYILVNKFLFGPEIPFTDTHLPGLRAPARGDIIVFKYPNATGRSSTASPWRSRTCGPDPSRPRPPGIAAICTAASRPWCPRAPISSWGTTATTPRTAGTGGSSSARRSAARPSSSTGRGTGTGIGCAGADSGTGSRSRPLKKAHLRRWRPRPHAQRGSLTLARISWSAHLASGSARQA
ncbi:MAG: signal peptidase I, partial [Candidatus Rokubacteria bacterium]|nr:signal peptidase I [Candidatus Rokubacteria bacterium]